MQIFAININMRNEEPSETSKSSTWAKPTLECSTTSFIFVRMFTFHKNPHVEVIGKPAPAPNLVKLIFFVKNKLFRHKRLHCHVKDSFAHIRKGASNMNPCSPSIPHDTWIPKRYL